MGGAISVLSVYAAVVWTGIALRLLPFFFIFYFFYTYVTNGYRIVVAYLPWLSECRQNVSRFCMKHIAS
jgi:hypothetical protein